MFWGQLKQTNKQTRHIPGKYNHSSISITFQACSKDLYEIVTIWSKNNSSIHLYSYRQFDSFKLLFFKKVVFEIFFSFTSFLSGVTVLKTWNWSETSTPGSSKTICYDSQSSPIINRQLSSKNIGAKCLTRSMSRWNTKKCAWWVAVVSHGKEHSCSCRA